MRHIIAYSGLRFGRGSALDRFVELDGRILLLGCDHDTVTFLHYAEHIVDLPGKLVARYSVPVLDGGQRVWRAMEEFDTSGAAHPELPGLLLRRIVDAYLVETRNRGGLVGDAQCYLVDARGLLPYALAAMQAAAADSPATE